MKTPLLRILPMLIVCCIFALCTPAFALNLGDIVTVAGGGDGGLATAASLNTPYGITVDSSGNLYIADRDNHRVRKVTAATGIITTVAGIGTSGFSGDSGLATSASLNGPSGVTLDSDGNLYIADKYNNRIRKVTAATGIITTVAGNGTGTFAGDGGSATSASLNNPTGVTVDSSRNLFIADFYNNRIRKVTAATGFISTVAGNGSTTYNGDGIAATSASVANPNEVTLDSSGNLYIAENYNSRIRKVTATTGIITTVAGGGAGGLNDGAAATGATLQNPFAVSVDSSGNIYFADYGNYRIRKVTVATGIITTVAGNGSATFSGDGGLAISAAIGAPTGLVFDSSGNFYIAATNNKRIRKVIIASGIITTVAGNGSASFAGDNYAATSASLSTPVGVSFDSSGNLYIADYSNQRIRKVDVATAIITTIAGNGIAIFAGDNGVATSASLNYPFGVSFDSSGDLYIADRNNNRIRKVAASTGIITTIAGNGAAAFAGDNGAATSASLNSPYGVSVDSSGNLYIADYYNHRIRKVTAATGIITTIAGNGTGTFAGDNGVASSASLNYPVGVSVDSSGNLYIADYGNHRIRKVTVATGIITTIAGNGTGAFAGDNGAATSASLKNPHGVSVDSSGNLYIADCSNSRIRKVYAASGIITTIAGNGIATFAGDNGVASSASLNDPVGVSVDSSGNLYIADSSNNRIRKVYLNVVPTVSAISSSVSNNTTSSGDSVTFTATLTSSDGIPDGNVIFKDGATTLATVPLDSSGKAVFTTTSFAFGGHSITAVYEVTGIYAAATSAPLVHFVADITPSTARYSNQSSGSIAFSANPGATFQCSLDGADFSNCSPPFIYSGLANGQHILVVKADDGAGNISAPIPYVWTIDSSLTINSPLPTASALGQIITRVGEGKGDNGAATSASLNGPYGVSVDSSGNLYIADQSNHRIRKVTASTGIITTIAGNGTATFTGDNSAATSASLNYPSGVSVDSSGNLYIADQGNHRIRKVTASTGIITTIAGNGTGTFSGDNGAATSASLAMPRGVSVDSSGNLYIADSLNHRIRKVTAATGIITTVAGNGTSTFAGDNGAATSASLSYPYVVSVDSSGNLYIADTNNQRIRKVTAATGIITTMAGNGTAAFSGDNGAATSAGLYNPFGVSVDSSGNLYIADYNNQRIRKVTAATGIISTMAGNGTAAFSGDNGAATAASLYAPTGVTLDSSGNLYIAVLNNHRIRKVTAATGIITTVAGNGTTNFAGDNGAATSASLSSPDVVSVDSSGNLYIADSLNHRIRKVIAATGIITTIAGNGTGTFAGDNGAATRASLYNPNGVSVDSSGNLYIADTLNHRIRKVTAATGIITTIAGNGTGGFSGDNGAATSASLNNPTGVIVDSSGNLYIADFYNNRIRKVTAASGFISTVAGNGTGTFAGDNGAATSASLSSHDVVSVDSSGNLYIADYSNHRIRKVTTSTGIITTIAGNGNGTATFSGDGAAATAASLYYPARVIVDSSGNLYIADYSNHRIRKLTASTGIITTIAGNGTGTFAGDNGAATSASLNNPRGVSVDSSGNLYVADQSNHRIRKVYLNPVPTVSTVVSSSPGNASNLGASVTFTAAVTSSEGTPTATAVTFKDGTTTLGTAPLDARGWATLTTSALSVGNHTITVVYPDAGILQTSTSPELLQTVIGAPLVARGSASLVTIATATLNGTANDNGGTTTVTFQYGLTNGYGASVSGGTVAAGSGTTAVSAAITGLSCGTTYHFRGVGQNSTGTTNGSDAIFTTSACPVIPTSGSVQLNYPGKAGNTFTVYRSKAGRAGEQIYSGSLKSFTDSAALLSNTIYQYYVTSDTDPTQTSIITIRTPLYKGWNIIGVPYNTVGVALAAIFSIPVSSGYQWISRGNADPDNNGGYATVTTLNPALGYFIRPTSATDTMLAYSGTLNTLPTMVTLKPGWTLISNPTTSNLSGIGASWLVDSGSLNAAVTAGTIGGDLYWWNGSTYDSWKITDLVLPMNSAVVEPWKAYWILNLDAIEHTLTIQ